MSIEKCNSVVYQYLKDTRAVQYDSKKETEFLTTAMEIEKLRDLGMDIKVRSRLLGETKDTVELINLMSGATAKLVDGNRLIDFGPSEDNLQTAVKTLLNIASGKKVAFVKNGERTDVDIPRLNIIA